MDTEEDITPDKRVGESYTHFQHNKAQKPTGISLETVGNLYPPLIDLGSQPRSTLVDDSAASVYLGVTTGTLSVWRSSGRYPLPFVKVGRRVRYRVGDILDFVESRIHDHTSSQQGR